MFEIITLAALILNMTITKTKLLDHLRDLPEEIEMEVLIERLLFVEKLEHRIELSKKDITLSETALEKEMNEWFESNG